MATLTLYTAVKRSNSTLVPTNGTDVEVHLKEGTDMLSPSFLMNLIDMPTWSMCKFNNRYYFITRVRNVNNNLWEIDCEVDVLATYKTNILATNAYVAYSSNLGSAQLIDSRIGSALIPLVSTPSSKLSSFYKSTGMYCLQVLGSGSGGFVKTYFCTQSALNSLINLFFSDEELKTELDKYFSSAFDCIVKCAYTHMIPAGLQRTIQLGDYDSGISAIEYVGTDVVSEHIELSVPKPYNDWRNCGNSYRLSLPYCGIISISTHDLLPLSTLDISCRYDWRSGTVRYTLLSAAGESSPALATYVGSFFSEIPVARYGNSLVGSLASIPVVGNPLASLVRGVIGKAEDLLGDNNNLFQFGYEVANSAIQNTASMSGGFGSVAVTFPNFELLCEYQTFQNRDVAVMGAPYMGTTSIAGCTGYLQTNGFSVSGSMTAVERNKINNMMNGGVYIE